MDFQTISRLREELSKFMLWLSKHSDRFFSSRYTIASNEYLEKTDGVVDPHPGTATSHLV